MFNIYKMDEMERKIEFYSISRSYLCGIICLCLLQFKNIFSGNNNYNPLVILAGMGLTRGLTRIMIKKRLNE